MKKKLFTITLLIVTLTTGAQSDRGGRTAQDIRFERAVSNGSGKLMKDVWYNMFMGWVPYFIRVVYVTEREVKFEYIK